jgi:chromosome segregation ATPase
MKNSSSESKLFQNPLNEEKKNLENSKEKALTKKNKELTKEIIRLNDIISRMSEEREYYMKRVQERDRTFLSDNELRRIQNDKSENERKIAELKNELNNKNNENNELIKEINDLKSKSSNMTKLYETLLSKMDKFIEACNKQ